MSSPSSAKRLRRAASVAFGLSLAALSLKLMACFVSPVPTDPHKQESLTTDPSDASLDVDPPDASDDADASEDAP